MKPKFILPPALRSAARVSRRRLLYAENGNLIGESHHKAVLTDRQVDAMCELRAAGWTYRMLSEKFEIPIVSVKSICTGRTRSVAIARVVTAGRQEQ